MAMRRSRGARAHSANRGPSVRRRAHMTKEPCVGRRGVAAEYDNEQRCFSHHRLECEGRTPATGRWRADVAGHARKLAGKIYAPWRNNAAIAHLP